MYKFLFSVLLCYYGSIYACDFCGNSPALLNTDILSVQPQSSIGTSVQYRNYKFLTSNENMKRSQIVTQNFFVSYAPKSWVDIRLSMPIMWMLNDYIEINQNTPKLKEKKFGPGDMILFSNFRVLSKPAIGNRRVGHTLNLGTGMSFPTGSKKESANLILQDFNFGTQTVSFLFSGTYSMSINNWGLVNAAFVRLNIYNKNHTKYGNSYTYQITGNYTHFFNHITVIPMLGLKFDASQKNLHNSIIQPRSGSWDVAANIGLQCVVKDFSFYLSVVQPMAKRVSANTIKEKTSFNCTLRYVIERKKKFTKNETIKQ